VELEQKSGFRRKSWLVAVVVTAKGRVQRRVNRQGVRVEQVEVAGAKEKGLSGL
jgi:hypothetical protein